MAVVVLTQTEKGLHKHKKRWTDAAELAGGLFQLARRWMAEIGVEAVRFCPVLPRGPGCFRGSPLAGVAGPHQQPGGAWRITNPAFVFIEL